MRILACIPMPYDATSFYRAYGVFPNLRKNYINNLHVDNYVGGGKRTWAELLGYDVLFLQRPAHPDWLKLAEYMKGLGKKVWVDHDDNLFCLPPYNRVVDTYTNTVKKSMLDILKIADVVTVSTPALQQYFMDNFAVQSVVIPNALNEALIPMAESYNVSDKIERFLWRGSETHQADIMTHQEQLNMAIAERHNTFWDFLGYNPFFVTMNHSNNKWRYYVPEDIMIYSANLRAIKPTLMHVPLIDDGLNACKSNIAWIEATAAGAVTIAPDWPEWQRPGIINYNNVQHYGELLLKPTDVEHNRERWQASKDYIMENLLLTHVNKKRYQILTQL